MTVRVSTDRRGPLHFLVRAAWLGQAALVLALMISGAPGYFELLRTPCAGAGCAYFQLPQTSAQALAQAGLPPQGYAVYLAGLTIGTLLVMGALAALIFWRNTDHWLAAYLSVGLLALGPTFFGALTGALIAHAPGWRLPAGLLQGLSLWVLVPFGFLFPTGRFVPAWTRPLAFLLTLPASALLLFTALQGQMWSDVSGGLELLLQVPLFVTILASAVAQVYRFRHVSGPVERQQAKWVVFGLVLFLSNAFVFVLAGTLPVFRQPGLANALYYLVGGTLNVLTFLAFLVSVALSVVRYRLWDIDLIIRRTLVYSALSVVLAAAYLVSVLVLQNLFRAVTREGQNALVTVLSTLAIAALFGPVRSRVQRAIDRRFYRQKYDAARTLAAFGAQARDVVELEQLSEQLLAAVDQTMQPAHVGLWVRKPDGR